MAQHGGKRAGAGRKVGAVSKVKRDLAEMAKDHAEAALGTLAKIMKDEGQPGAARVSAANALLDRGYGKPVQGIDHKSTDGSMVPQPSLIQIVAAEDDSGADPASS